MPSKNVNVRLDDELRRKLKAIQRHHVLDGASEAVRLAIEAFYETLPPNAKENPNVAQVNTCNKESG